MKDRVKQAIRSGQKSCQRGDKITDNPYLYMGAKYAGLAAWFDKGYVEEQEKQGGGNDKPL
jgi:hypothetical protein